MKRNRDIISFFRDGKAVKPKSVEVETTQTQGGGGTNASRNRNELALVVASSIPSMNAPSQSQHQPQSEAQATGNDSRLTYSIRCLRFILRQGLACRGHDESSNYSNKGNFLELLE